MNKIKKLFIRKKRKNESLFKYVMGVFHLWGALVSSLVICIVCITGCIYAFQTQIKDLYNYDLVFIDDTENQTINPNEIEKKFILEKKEINSIFIPKNPERSWIISYKNHLSETKSTYFNPYTKTELGSPENDLEGFFQTVLELHRNLLLGNFGRQIVGVCIVFFVLLLFSGFVLWLPKKFKQLKENLTIKTNGKFQRVNYDLHRVLGIYALIPLLFISITGLYITYPWVKNGIIISLGGESISDISYAENTQQEDDFSKLMAEMLAQQNEKENETGSEINLNQVLEEIQKHLNYQGNTTIIFPNEESPRYNITKINSENTLGMLLTDEISLGRSGELKSKNLFADKPLHKKFVALARPLHTGEIMGLPSIIFYFVVSLIGFTLPITGLMIWWNRVKKQL